MLRPASEDFKLDFRLEQTDSATYMSVSQFDIADSEYIQFLSVFVCMLVYSAFKSCLPALKFAPLLLAIAEPLSTKIIMAEASRPSSSGGLPY